MAGKQERAGSKGGPADALELLQQDHRRVDRMFDEYPRGTTEQKETFFEEIKHQLDAHAAIEEELFYPALKAAGGRAAELVEKAQVDHFGVKTLLGAIAAMHPEDEGYDARVMELRDDVRRHVAEEEREIFAAARKQLGAARLGELAAEMGTRKGELREEMSDVP
jgi:hemerythrin superfamily protein